MQTTISSTNNVSIVIHLWDGLSDVDKNIFEAYQSSKNSKVQKIECKKEGINFELFRLEIAQRLRDSQIHNPKVEKRLLKYK
jgi:hypothetical protein